MLAHTGVDWYLVHRIDWVWCPGPLLILEENVNHYVSMLIWTPPPPPTNTMLGQSITAQLRDCIIIMKCRAFFRRMHVKSYSINDDLHCMDNGREQTLNFCSWELKQSWIKADMSSMFDSVWLAAVWSWGLANIVLQMRLLRLCPELAAKNQE